MLYINGKMAYTDKYIKITSEDAQAGIKFDASPTVAAGATDIKNSTWSISYENKEIFNESIDGFP